ncbi:phosphoadenosine phosphosulfate reductase family protein [uncultured Dubosiella sp.]|uniref:phosphoadenosine phosphosulfate reductase domain-containing protein n=1 Tax=uncultured Dubosiella sp. TaxID=1937011 RepID=UPI00260900FE|nr:phosphoadenosine phosphosulfate reductase family protein [uncultured Dubosiella sp.]
MKKYHCLNCKTDVDTSECPICGARTVLKTKLYWNEEKNIPVISDSVLNHYIGSDIRPVFPEERLLIEILLNDPLKYINSSCWSVGGGVYFIDGNKVEITIKNLGNIDDDHIRNELLKYAPLNSDEAFDKYVNRFINEHELYYKSLETEAMNYVTEKVQKFDFNSMFVSFSGGKDSTVVSDLVTRALGTPKVVHIFGDTTLEFPETYDYVKRFRSEHRFTPMLNAKNKEKDFYEMCEVIGPPSRMMRWCCTVFKTGAITNYTTNMFKTKKKVLTFYGIRRSESVSRSKYERESDSPKIAKQRTVSPIIDWLDIDVWLYLLTRKIDFNDAYRFGFTRVGCWCCPNNSGWSTFLSRIYHPKEFYSFRDLLIRNAKVIGKPDPEEYVDSGAWRAKQGGEGIEYGKKKVITFESCATEENAFNYELQKPIDENLYEMFKPFGTLNFEMGNKRLGEVYVLDNQKRILMKLQGKVGQNHLKISIINFPIANTKTIRDAKGKIQCQLTKFQMCLNCSGCVSTCRFGAIRIKEENGKLKYRINENKCVHCYECINHYTSGCYMRKVLTIKNADLEEMTKDN